MTALYEIRTERGRKGIRLNLHPGQRRAWESTRRFVAIIAGSQSGKTSFEPLWLHREIYNKGPGDYVFVCPTFALMELKALPEFKRLFQDVWQLGEYTGSPVRRFRFSEEGCKRLFGNVPDVPTQVFFGYAENPDSLESATYKAAVLDEAGQKAFKRESFEALQRRLALHQGRMLVGTTPYAATGWLRELYERWKAGDKEVDCINFPSVANPAFPQAEYDRAAAHLPAWKFNLFYRGHFDRPAGMIYDCFEESRCVVPAFRVKARWPRFLGLDFGAVNMAGVFLAREGERYYLYRSYKKPGLTCLEHARELKKDEPSLPFTVGGAPRTEDGWREAFQQAGLPVRPPPVNDVEIGINRVYGALKQGKLLICSDQRGLIDELNSYSRVLDEKGEPTEKIENKETYHLLDALRYIGCHLFREFDEKWKFDPPEESKAEWTKAPPGVWET